MNGALKTLARALTKKDVTASSQAAIDVAQSALDLELLYRPSVEVDRCRAARATRRLERGGPAGWRRHRRPSRRPTPTRVIAVPHLRTYRGRSNADIVTEGQGRSVSSWALGTHAGSALGSSDRTSRSIRCAFPMPRPTSLSGSIARCTWRNETSERGAPALGPVARHEGPETRQRGSSGAPGHALRRLVDGLATVAARSRAPVSGRGRCSSSARRRSHRRRRSNQLRVSATVSSVSELVRCIPSSIYRCSRYGKGKVAWRCPSSR